MYKRLGEKKLGRKASHRRSLVRNQIVSLFGNGKVITTSPKAKVLRSNAESIIKRVSTKTDDYMLSRYLVEIMGTDSMLKVLKEYASSKGTGVSIVKVGFRKGDNSEISEVAITGYDAPMKKKSAATKTSVSKRKVKEEAAKEPVASKLEEKKKEEIKENIGSKLAQSLKNKFVSKERVRARSGL